MPASPALVCDYAASRWCTSCPRIDQSYTEQLAAKQARTAAVLADTIAPERWLDPVGSAVGGFRTRVKIAVGGSYSDPQLGFVDAGGQVRDIRRCPIQDSAITEVLPKLAAFITTARIHPYDIHTRRGELKYLLITATGAGLMVRFVLRSTEAEARIRKYLSTLLTDCAVVTLNILPDHKAVTEGPREIVLTDTPYLAMPLSTRQLTIAPQSFTQTNTEVADQLYRAVAAAADICGPESVYDLYCGVGGFALHLARPGRNITGVELSPTAIDAARQSAAGLPAGCEVVFVADDALSWARQQPPADLVVVNPPRRGIGSDLAAYLNRTAGTVIYSSCYPLSLARDLAELSEFQVLSAQIFDMFPHTSHVETVCVLARA